MFLTFQSRPDFFWWTGQNQRTFEIGIFPRCWTEPLRRRNGEDISVPLRHSFIHTGNLVIGSYRWKNLMDLFIQVMEAHLGRLGEVQLQLMKSTYVTLWNRWTYSNRKIPLRLPNPLAELLAL